MVICNEKVNGKTSGKQVNQVNSYTDLPKIYLKNKEKDKPKTTNINANRQITNKSNKHLPNLPNLPKNTETNLKQWISLLYDEDCNLKGQMFQYGGRWWSLFRLDEPVNRTICSNELVFDIDVENGKVFDDDERWIRVRTFAENLKKTLRELDIDTELWFYSGRNLHCSIFFDKNISYPFEIMVDYVEKCGFEKFTVDDLQKLAKDMRFAIFKYIVANVEKVDGVEFDFNVMSSGHTEQRHMIRLCGAENEKTGYYKSYVKNIPDKEPKIKENDVIFPEKIKYVKNIPDSLLFFVYDKYIEKRNVKRKYITLGQERAWIEKMLNQPIPDGRHRTIDLVLVPYLVEKGLSDEDIVKMVLNWYEKCLDYNKGSIVKVVNGKRKIQRLINENYVLDKISYVRKRNMKPISRKNATWLQSVVMRKYD